MAQYEKLDIAPITEALVDIQIEPLPQDFLSQLKTMHDRIIKEYPQSKQRIRWQGQFKIDQGVPSSQTASGGPDGFLFTSTDQKQIVQARLDGFTFNRLQPYTDWDTFKKSAKQMWKFYVEVAQPKAVVRTGLRYINRIEIPLPMKDLKEYFSTGPDISLELTVKTISEYFMRIVIPINENESTVILTQAIEPGDYQKSIPVIFDIDVFCRKMVDPKSDALWGAIDGLKELRSDFFFKSITDKTKRLFKK